MDIVALVVSIVALFAAGWSAWGTHRQAKATETQAQAARAANATAQAALDVARSADARDQARQHVEERPNFSVLGKRAKHKPLLVTVTIENLGPLAYDGVIVRPDTTDTDTKRLVRGMDLPDDLADEVTLGTVQPGETLTTALVRTNPELGGQAKLIVTATRGEREWATVHYVQVSRPSRIISM